MSQIEQLIWLFVVYPPFCFAIIFVSTVAYYRARDIISLKYGTVEDQRWKRVKRKQKVSRMKADKERAIRRKAREIADHMDQLAQIKDSKPSDYAKASERHQEHWTTTALKGEVVDE